MNQSVRTMLENMYELFYSKCHDQYKSWDHLVEFLAGDHSLSYFNQNKDNYKWILEDSDLVIKLLKTYDNKLLQSDFHDHLGDIYLENIVSKTEAKRKGQFLTPQHLGKMMAQMTIDKTDEKINILDPCVGSGRLLMEGYKQAPNATYFGVDLDLRMVRIAMTNFAIHGIKGYFLHANSLQHEIDISKDDGLANWQYANNWYSNIDKLKEINRGQNLTLDLQ